MNNTRQPACTGSSLSVTISCFFKCRKKQIFIVSLVSHGLRPNPRSQGYEQADFKDCRVELSFIKSSYDNPGLDPGEWIKAPPFMAPVGSGRSMSEVTLTVLMNIPFQSGALSEDPAQGVSII